jgi:outer membrane protein OmpA-like peptidoglycan-associated protein
MINWGFNRNYLSGSDFFISYSHTDGRFYATALSNLLQEKKYSCYLDMHTSQPGLFTPGSVLTKLKSANVLIVLSTPASRYSNEVRKEIELFVSTKRPVFIIGADIASDNVWKELVVGLPVNKVSAEAMLDGVVNDKLVSLLTATLTYTRQSLRIRRSVITAVMIFAIVAVSVAAGFLYFRGLVDSKNTELSISTGNLAKRKASLDSAGVELEKRKIQLDTLNMDLVRSRREITAVNYELTTSRNELLVGDKDGKYIYSKLDSMFRFINKLRQDEQLYIDEHRAALERRYARRKQVRGQVDSVYINLVPSVLDEHSAIFFDFDSAALSSFYFPLLDEIATELRSSGRSVEIRSYSKKIAVTDGEVKRNGLRWGLDNFYFPVATSVYSRMLSGRSAQSLVDYLIKSGVDASKITSKAYGQSRNGAAFHSFIRDWVEIVAIDN